MKITRLLTGPDKQSHFQEAEMELIDAYIGKITTSFPCGDIVFGEIEDDKIVTWHNPPCKQYVIMLHGAMEIEVGDGSRRIFREGDILLAEDTTGQGHRTHPASKGIRRYLVIPL
jgi:hypothetical protein